MAGKTPAETPEGSAESLADRSLLERALSIVTEVHAGEGITALFLTLNVFLLLTAYYVIKPVREGLILAMKSGAEYKSYLSAAIAIALLGAVPAYARVANKVPKNKLVVGVTLFFASHLVVFWTLSKIPSVEKQLGLVFFVWVGIFNMMVVAQFWAFANDLYNQEQGKRLFALVGIGASLGAALGAYVTNFLKDTLGLGVYELLLVSSMLLVGCAILTQMAHGREQALKAAAARGASSEMAPDAKGKERKKSTAGAFALVFSNKYLLMIAIFSLIFTFVNTNGEYMLSVLVKKRAAEAAIAAGVIGEDALRKFAKSYGTTFYGSFFLWVNVFGVAIQTFAVSRIVKLGGLRLAFFIFPVIALLDSVALVVLPAALAMSELSILRPGKIAENATDYSINNTVRNMLWLPTTTEMKYKAKQAVDTFFVRMGDVSSAAVVYFLGDRLGMGVRQFALLNAGLVAVWLFVARGIVKRNRELSDEAPSESPSP